MKKLIFSFTIYVVLLLPAYAIDVPAPLVEPEWLNQHLDEVTILDIRSDLKSFSAKPLFKKNKKTGKNHLIKIGGHIPGAMLVNYKSIRTSRTLLGKKVKKLIPDKKAFEKIMQGVGLNSNSTIVIVSKGTSYADMTMATRLYWQLKYFGVDNMAILNGGMAQWIGEKRKLAFNAAKPKRGNWLATQQRDEILASTANVKQAVDDATVQLIDNRSIDLYLGTWKKSYVYAKGHIPGAKLYPAVLLTSHGMPARFLPRKTISTLSSQLGIKLDKSTITYCNSGHLASGGWFVMHELLGNNQVKLYDGSMHEWTLMQGKVRAHVME